MSAIAAAPMPDSAYREEWLALESDPGPLVFLSGCQRSGTTWLHLQLARSGRFRYLSALDVYAFDSLVHHWRQGTTAVARAELEAKLAGAPEHRGIDAIPAGPDTPEEYGLVIASGEIRYDRPDTTEASLDRLRELCAKKALLDGRERPLLLKSPPDYPGGLERLAAAWPSALFVVIHRHPVRALDSQVRAWRELVGRPNAYLLAIDRGYRSLLDDAGRRLRLGIFLHSPAGVDWLAECVLRAHREYLELRERWAGGKLLEIRYEDLCADGGEAWGRLAAFLKMPLERPAEPPAPRSGAVAAEAQRAFAAQLGRFAPYLERFGYQDEPQ